MFYEKKIDNALRFGDVLEGYISVTPKISKPFFNKQDHNYNIDVGLSAFSVVLSPCCSIGEKKISLTPLIGIRKSFFDNPYFAQDLTGINRRMKPENAFLPNKWKKMSEQKKTAALKEDFVYTLIELFIYEQNSLFSEYSIRKEGKTVVTRYYMIDFRNIYKMNCDEIRSSTEAPIKSKCLQLSRQARAELRDKIVYYYARVPQEDEIQEI